MSAPHELPIDTSKTPDSFKEWNEELAHKLAAEEQIQLIDDHWDVIRFLRDHCEEHGTDCSARELLKIMADRYQQQGGKKYLYTLFPRGAVVQACKIAGIPLPSHATDPSFGSVH